MSVRPWKEVPAVIEGLTDGWPAWQGGGGVVNKHSTDAESPPPSPRVSMSIHPEPGHAPISI